MIGDQSRTLAAIMFTDMVGYSAKVQKNEKRALDQLHVHQNMVRSIYPNYSGKEIKTIGDAFMIQFKSALDAVLCAIAVQSDFKSYNTDKIEFEDQIHLRIGIHLGDVVEYENDIYGDGVNISSRLEPLAKPGSICISEDVARQVHNKIEFKLQKLPNKKLKNIDLSVEVYEIEVYESPTLVRPKKDTNKLAIIPFQNVGVDDRTDYFSDGLTEEITIRLTKIKNLEVIPRCVTVRYKDSQLDTGLLSSELNARYLLEGTVRKSGDRIKISTELIDAITDSHLWGEIYSGTLEDVFDIQEKLAKRIVNSLSLKLSPVDEVNLASRPTENSEAFDAYLRAREFLFRYTKNHLNNAIELFKLAIELDPKYAKAYAGISEAYGLLFETHDKQEKWLREAKKFSLKALVYDHDLSEAYSALALVYYNENNLNDALASSEKAIKLNNENYFAYWIKGRMYRMMGRDKEAVADFDKVLELNRNFHTAYGDLQMCYESLSDTEGLNKTLARAIEFYPQFLKRNPDDARAHIFYAFTLKRTGDFQKAVEEMDRGLKLSPNDAIILYNAACFYALINEKEKAIESLGMALACGFRNFEYIDHDPDFNQLRKLKSFQTLISNAKGVPHDTSASIED